MTQEEKRKYTEYLSLSDELADAESMGNSLLLDGQWASPGRIAAACVFGENNGYSRSIRKSKKDFRATIEFSLSD